jgi:hypothetical protein
MDINVSPDIQAYYCYLLVLLLGLWTAGTQVSSRLGNLPGKWIMLNTWFLFFAYTLIPLALFWLLDRTNAIHDTSLFAALLIGAGYQSILSGSFSSIKAPGDVSAFLKPFAAWADAIAAQIRDRVVINNSQFDENRLSSIVKDDGKFSALKQVVLNHTADPAPLSLSLVAFAANQAVLGDEGVRAKQAALLYLSLKQASPQQFQYLLYRSKVIPRRWYLWYAKEWRSKLTAIIVALVLASLAIAGGVEFTRPAAQSRYFVWRLHKENGTDLDRHRARTQLVHYMGSEPAVYSQLAALLTSPGLPGTTADDILSLLLETRNLAASQKVDLLGLLVNSLRTGSSDIRERIQRTLLYLADDRNLTVPEDLLGWHSNPKYDASDIDGVIKKWRQVDQ